MGDGLFVVFPERTHSSTHQKLKYVHPLTQGFYFQKSVLENRGLEIYFQGGPLLHY